VPIGIALGSALIPLLSILVIMLACVLGTWLVSLGDGGRTTVLVASWCLGLALALGLVGFGIWTIHDFSPSCRSTAQFVCFDTPAEQGRQVRTAPPQGAVGQPPYWRTYMK
jgi:hypothetical protein